MEEVKKKHNNIERTYKIVREVKPVKAPFAMLLMLLLDKFLHVDRWEA